MPSLSAGGEKRKAVLMGIHQIFKLKPIINGTFIHAIEEKYAKGFSLLHLFSS